MKIVISSSMKYKELIKNTTEELKELGFIPLFPNLNAEDERPINTGEEVKRLALDHYRAIDEADVAYFLTPQGYMGTSCKLELGYCVAKNKPIYFSEPTDDLALDCYVKEFIPTTSLERFLKI
ncbi:MAG: hypothetical protein ACQESA_02630 [Patescibacteria group bacterium]